MKFLKVLIIFLLVLYLYGCEPIRITHKIEPLDLESPKETVTTRKIPYEVIFIVDDTKKYTATHADYAAGVIHDFIFPAGNFIKQALPIISTAFEKYKTEPSLSAIPDKKTIVIDTAVNFMNVKLDCCLPLVFDTKTTLRFNLYDNDLIVLSLPVYSEGKGSLSKPGLFATMNDKEYAQVAYQSIKEALKNSIDVIYEVVNNPKKVISDAKLEINKNPSNTFAYTVIANRSLKLGDYAEALAAAQMITQLDPKDTNGYFLLYKIYKAQRKIKGAMEQLEQAFTLKPNNATLFIHLYNFYIEQEKPDKAMNAVTRYMQARPDDKYAATYLGMLYLTKGKYDDAISISQKMIDSLKFYGIGASISKEKDLTVVKSVEKEAPAEKAGIKLGDIIKEIDGTSTEELKIDEVVKKLRGGEGTKINLKIKRKDTEEPINLTLTRQKFYSQPSLVTSYLGITGMAQIHKGNIKEAKEIINEALNISKSTGLGIIPLKAYSTLLLVSKEYDKLINDFSKIDNDYVKLLIATAYAKKGEYDRSLKIFRTVNKKELSITEKTLKDFYEATEPYIQEIEKQAINYEKAGNISKALKIYGEIIDIVSEDKASLIRNKVSRYIMLNPAVVEISGTARQHFLNSEVLFNAGKYEEALQELEKAKSYIPFNPQIYFNSALVCEKIADYKGAIKNMEIFLQLQREHPQAQAIKDQIYKWKFILEREI
ncbi:tetratricopeptide repeat protein [Thermodesulfovibrio sp. 1176]|uniref:tetratricopeptide repeat protein n=1 Tax=Thermodesulfovibrio sp. 1176 TaxID=3043424 RepID=UPI0024824E33|nr:tetratricopeptide repeat protein [Thermodesulfovibrio sp. 1176]MDI1471035.1 tetratricopeptide repeat protein [Thermodesulfovibrio sp. 1176]